jgi:hypothetical protein
MQVTANIETSWTDYAVLALSGLTLIIILILAGLAYARRQLDSMAKERNIQALLHFLEVWDSAETIESRRLINDYDNDYDRNALPEAI